MSISFTKMHGLGNDFVIIANDTFSLSPEDIKSLAHRHIGIGFDQLLVISQSSPSHFFCRIFNSDGSEAEQCGNGLRCVAKFLLDKKLVANSFQIETKAGLFRANAHHSLITIELGIPDFNPDHIPVVAGELALFSRLPLAAKMVNTPVGEIVVSLLSLGNPHAIIWVNDVKHYPVLEVGAFLSTHSSFSKGINVGFVQRVSPSEIILRTYERGAGETLACGSNTCAAVVAGILNGQLEKEVTVRLALGSLTISWQGVGHPVVMTGPASYVYEGKLSAIPAQAGIHSANN